MTVQISLQGTQLGNLRAAATIYADRKLAEAEGYPETLRYVADVYALRNELEAARSSLASPSSYGTLCVDPLLVLDVIADETVADRHRLHDRGLGEKKFEREPRPGWDTVLFELALALARASR